MTLNKDPPPRPAATAVNSSQKPKPKKPENLGDLEIFKHRSTMSNIWSAIIFLFNVWTLFTTILWASVKDLPTGLNPMLYVFIECVLFFEVIARILLKFFLPTVYNSMSLHHMNKSDGFWVYGALIAGSFPFITLHTAISNDGESAEKTVIFARLLLIKLLRTLEITRTIVKIEEILFYKKFKTLVLVKFFKNLMIIVFVTHLFTCFWLLVETSVDNSAIIKGADPEKKFETSETYLERNDEEHASLSVKYMDSLVWASSSLLAASFGDVTPRTYQEVELSLVTLLSGIILLAMIFSDFASLMYLLDIEREQAKTNAHQALKLCKIIGVSHKIRSKVTDFYSYDNRAFSQTQYISAIKELPKSLHTDIVLSVNADIINKVNLFNFGSPDLLITIARMLYPKVSMAGDFVIRTGDDADDMYFIKQGEVEVLAIDSKKNEVTRLAILREGAYFGEIGLLLNVKRTVSIRTLTVCVFEVIDRADFEILMETYPEQKKFLFQVADQRSQVCTKEDILLGNGIMSDSNADLGAESGNLLDGKDLILSPRLKSINAAHMRESTKKLYNIIWDRIVHKFRMYACVAKDLDFSDYDRIIILPTSKFWNFWTSIIGISVFLNQIIVPYEISFTDDTHKLPAFWRTLDVIVVFIQLFDIVVHMNTSFKKKGVFVSNKDLILQKYFGEKFAIDLIAFMPVDYIMLGLNISTTYTHWIKLLRIFKFPRFFSMLFTIRESGASKSNSFLLLLGIFHIALNHIAACVMHMIANHELQYDEDCLLTRLDKTNEVDQPLWEQSASVRYINFIYWAFSVSSAGAYGDIIAVTPNEKLFQTFMLLFFKIYYTFIAAEVKSIFTGAYVSFKENLDKKNMYDRWLAHINTPKELVLRVKRYNEHMFEKYKGLDENRILSELPSTTRYEIIEFMLSDLLESADVFSKDEVGLFANLVDDLRFLTITEGECVFRAGEAAEEVYFIMEGEVTVQLKENSDELATLKKNEFFGETSIIDGKIGIRSKFVKAKTDVALAVLQLKHLKELWKKYPNVHDKMIKSTEEKRLRNKMGKIEHDEHQDHNKEVNDQKNSDKAKKALLSVDRSAYVSDFDRLHKELELSGDLNQSNASKLPLTSFRKNEGPIEPSSPSMKMETEGHNKMKKDPSDNNWQKEPLAKTSWDIPHDGTRGGKMLERIGSNPIENFDKSRVLGSPDLGSDLNVEGDTKTAEVFPKIKKNLLHGAYSGARSGHHTIHKKPLRQRLAHGFVKGLYAFERHFKKIRPLVLNLILFFDVMFAPLNIALELAHGGPLEYIELTFASILVLNFLLDLKDYLKQRKQPKKVFPSSIALSILEKLRPRIPNDEEHEEGGHGHGQEHGKGHKGGHHEHEVTLLQVFLDAVFAVPFTIVFHKFHVHGASENPFLIAIQLIKLLAVEHLTWIFQQEAFKKRYALNNILVILYAFIIANHFFACVFIIIANAHEDKNETWYAKIPAPQFEYPDNDRDEEEFEKIGDFTKYISATYWAYMTTSHVGMGDVTAVNKPEKIYVTIVMLFSTFLHAFLFGNLASLVDDLTPKFQKEFETRYRTVLEYAKTAKLDLFIEKIHKYYNYIWQDSKGIDENDILATLPNSIRYDIFLKRYESVIYDENTKFFQDEEGKFSEKIFYFFSKKMKIGIFMEGDVIVSAGQELSDIFIILEGEAELASYNDNEKKFETGSHLGGIIPNLPQFDTIKAAKITKVAIISQADFNDLREAFPAWYQKISKADKIFTTLSNCIDFFRKNAIERRTKPYVPTKSASSRKMIKGQSHTKVGEQLAVPVEESRRPSEMYVDTEETDSRKGLSKREINRNRDIPKVENKARKDAPTALSNDFLNPIHASPRLPNSPHNNNELPPGDKEPLEDHGIEKQKNGAWAELADNSDTMKDEIETAVAGAKIHHGESNHIYQSKSPSANTAQTATPQNFNFPKSQSPSYLESPSTKDQGKHMTKRTSMFRPESEHMEPQPTQNPKRGFFTSIKTFFSRGTKRVEVGSPNYADKSMDNSALDKPTGLARAQTKMSRKSIRVNSNSSKLPATSQALANVPDNRPSSSHSHAPSFGGEDDDDENMSDFDSKRRRRNSTSKKQQANKTIKKKNMGGLKFTEVLNDQHKFALLMASLNYYIHPNSIWKIIYELIHTIVIIYSVVAVPVYVGFEVDLGWGFIVGEVLILIELLIYPILLMRTASYHQGILKIQSKKVWQGFLEKGFVTYLLAVLPLYLIFELITSKDHLPLWIEGILKLNRVLLIFKISSQFAFFSSKYPQITRVLNIIKPTFYLGFVSHFISCMFSFCLLVEPSRYLSMNFDKYLELDKANLSTRYMISLDFVLSLVTTTGYPELIVYNDYERLIFVLFVYLGDALFALILGWYASNSTTIPEKYNYVFGKIRKMDYILEDGRIPPKTRKKIENYFAYIVHTRNRNKSCLEFLSGLLPSTTLKGMAFEQAKAFQSFPLVREFKGNRVLINEIIKSLNQRIYLNHDYVVNRHDYGSEAYCIAEGEVHMLSPNEKSVMIKLKSEDCFGELGIYTTTRRITSFIAADFTLIYILEREVLKEILKAFPQALNEYETFVEQKLELYCHGDQKKRALKAHNTLEKYSREPQSKLQKIKDFLLERFEVPVRGSEKAVKKPSDNESGSGGHFKKSVDERSRDLKADDDNEESFFPTLTDDIIEDEELTRGRHFDMKKNSFRVKPAEVGKHRERRLSRVQRGTEKSASKMDGLTIKWGINLH